MRETETRVGIDERLDDLAWGYISSREDGIEHELETKFRAWSGGPPRSET